MEHYNYLHRPQHPGDPGNLNQNMFEINYKCSNPRGASCPIIPLFYWETCKSRGSLLSIWLVQAQTRQISGGSFVLVFTKTVRENAIQLDLDCDKTELVETDYSSSAQDIVL